MLKSILSTLRGGAIVAIGVGALLLAGCGGSSSSDSASAKPTQQGGTLKLAEVEEVQNFIPTVASGETSIHMIGQIMEPLVMTNSESKLEPWLAKKYTRSDDNLTWTFELREGVKFSNGEPLTADDVVFSINKAKESVTWSFMFDRIAKVRATSPTTVVLELSKPDSGLLSELSVVGAYIVPENYGGLTEKEFGQSPIGTGPFTLASWKHGQGLTLAANPSYWREGEPILDRVEASTVTNANTRVAQMRGGELEAVLAPAFSQRASLEQTPGTTLGRYVWALIDQVLLGDSSPVFNDLRARQAFDLAIDRQSIIETAAAGEGKPAGSWVPSSVNDWNPDIEPTVQDTAKAKQLLAEAVKDGAKSSFTMLYAANDPYWTTATQIMQQQLEEVGFEVKLRPLDISALTETLFGSGYEALCWTGGKPDIADQSEYTSIYVVTNAIGTGAPTDEIEKLAEEARSTYNPDKIRQRYYETQEIIDEESYTVNLDEQQFTWALKSNIAGFDTNLTGRPTLASTGFTD